MHIEYTRIGDVASIIEIEAGIIDTEKTLTKLKS